MTQYRSIACGVLLSLTTSVCCGDDTERQNLTGQWKSPNGSVFTMIDSGTRVSIYLASSPNLELVDAEFVRDDKGLLVATYWFAVFKNDPGKELRSLRMQGRMKNGRIIFHGDECTFHSRTVRTSTMKRDPILTRITTAARGEKDGAGVPVAELRQEQQQIEETLFQLRLELTDAYADYRAAYTEGNAFANLRPAQRTTTTISDLYNGTIIDGRYKDEPVIELSPASPRYGRIVAERDRAGRKIQGLVAEISRTTSRLESVVTQVRESD